MTTIEFYYLMMCLTAFAVFAVVLAYNEISWRKWKTVSKSAQQLPSDSKIGLAH